MTKLDVTNEAEGWLIYLQKFSMTPSTYAFDLCLVIVKDVDRTNTTDYEIFLKILICLFYTRKPVTAFSNNIELHATNVLSQNIHWLY